MDNQSHEDKFIKWLIRFVLTWSLGALITYGHIYREYQHECKISVDKYACYSMRMDTFMATIVWPYHWSEVMWSMTDGGPK